MPVKITGMIGTQQEGVAVHLIKGKISREWVIDFTRLHEQWDYDSVLVGYYASAAEGFGIALYAADHTERIKFLIAHRPGSVAPALAARQVATFDQLTQGRMSLHIIAGTSDEDQASEGDFLPKNDRYRRAGEYLDVMRKMWTSDSPFDHRGEFYRVEGAYSDIKPYQQPYPRAVLRRLVGRRAADGGRTLRRVRDLRRTARGDARPAGRFPPPHRRVRTPRRFQHVAAHHHGRQRGRGLGQGATAAGRCRTQDRRSAATDQSFQRTAARLRRARRCA